MLEMDAGDLISLIITIGIESVFLWLLFTLRSSVFRIERLLSEMESRMELSGDAEDKEDRS